MGELISVIVEIVIGLIWDASSKRLRAKTTMPLSEQRFAELNARLVSREKLERFI